MIGKNYRPRGGVNSSVVEPKLFILDPDPTLTLISDPDSGPDPDSDLECLRKIYLKCRSSKHSK